MESTAYVYLPYWLASPGVAQWLTVDFIMEKQLVPLQLITMAFFFLIYSMLPFMKLIFCFSTNIQSLSGNLYRDGT